MGIVVCLAMLAGLLMFLPDRLLPKFTVSKAHASQSKRPRLLVSLLLLLIGSWNIFWYGLQHLERFWGMVALGSGVVMLLAAFMLAAESFDGSNRIPAVVYQWLKPLRPLLIIGLLVSFLLYAVTLVQLNLGFPIIQ